NHFGTSNHFDNQHLRFHHLQQQQVLPTDRHLLAVCPICQRPWYKAGRGDYPRLTPEQLTFLGEAFGVDTQALYLLPRALCTICSTLHLGGVFSAEVYAHQMGYRFRWESVSSRRVQLLAMVCRSQELTLDTLVQ